MNFVSGLIHKVEVSAGCHINDVMNAKRCDGRFEEVSAGCHINDVMNSTLGPGDYRLVSAGCHINDVMNLR